MVTTIPELHDSDMDNCPCVPTWAVEILAYDSDGLNPQTLELKMFKGPTAEPDAERWAKAQIARFSMPVKAMLFDYNRYWQMTFRRSIR